MISCFSPNPRPGSLTVDRMLCISPSFSYVKERKKSGAISHAKLVPARGAGNMNLPVLLDAADHQTHFIILLLTRLPRPLCWNVKGYSGHFEFPVMDIGKQLASVSKDNLPFDQSCSRHKDYSSQ